MHRLPAARILAALLAAAPLPMGAAIAQAPLAPRVVALENSAHQAIGQIVLTDAPKGVLLHVELGGLTPGWHAIHFHEKADCSDAAFKMAGGHVHTMAPTVHGLLNPQANDQGDLPNIYADATGAVHADLFSNLVSLRAGTARAELLDPDGSAIVIHAKPDDYTTQPIGGAGDRMACGVIR